VNSKRLVTLWSIAVELLWAVEALSNWRRASRNLWTNSAPKRQAVGNVAYACKRLLKEVAGFRAIAEVARVKGFAAANAVSAAKQALNTYYHLELDDAVIES